MRYDNILKEKEKSQPLAGYAKNRTLVSLQAEFVNIQSMIVRYISTEREKVARYTDDCGWYVFDGG